ncbi:MAG: gliding motility-associated ABC transporter substrate-binding protein GldG [Bacteroidales bacterium]|nr:gliding motility-associated ABC transporter substrate-binding protein GldG [Bacteroidales bacterium]
MGNDKTSSDKRQNVKLRNVTQLMLGLLIIVLANVIGSYIFTRFDLTTEKRYSLSDATRNMLHKINDLVYFRVYLDGEFPAGFKRLSRETRDMLSEFRAYNKNIEFEFINPSASSDNKEREQIYTMLVENGLEPTDLQVKTKDGTSQKIIFPGAIATFRGKEMAVNLLASKRGAPPEEILNNSIQNLEFALADAIRKLVDNKRPKIAFIEGHGELNKHETADAYLGLSEYYSIERIRLDGKLNSLTERLQIDSISTRVKNKYEAIIIAKPDSVFSDKDKFIIDQFIMRGGKVLWLIDPVYASMDSLQQNTETIGIDLNLGLTDMFFRYGFRINSDLVMDINALPIPVKVGDVGGQPQFDFFPWYFFPILTPLADDPIVKNLNAIKTEFISSIDFVESSPDLDKEVLLTSSKYSRTVNTPAYIALSIVGQQPDERLYRKEFIPVAVKIEGEFESLFDKRIPPEIADNSDIDFQATSKKTKMIVIADGDIIRNQMQMTKGNYLPMPLGYDRYTGQQFGNKELILNAMNYLTDDSGLISIRSRDLKLRMLDRTKVENERVIWQVLNTILPVVLIIIFGIIRGIIRKRKYAR